MLHFVLRVAAESVQCVFGAFSLKVHLETTSMKQNNELRDEDETLCETEGKCRVSDHSLWIHLYRQLPLLTLNHLICC